MSRLITQAAYARHRGISREAVGKAVKKGWITLINGKIDPKRADRDWAKNTLDRVGQPAKRARKAPKARAKPAKQGSDDDQFTYTQARTQRERANAKLAELDLKERAGMLINADEARAHTFHNQRALRDLFVGITDRVAPRLILQPEQVVRHVIDEEIQRTLAVIANAPTL